ncbi:deoxyhypusine synthase family protein [Candidatus Micrarchaeota archaeon]|nr:deoxyhypusine synthase family protein [Candidatus Micrarchaeota archaeon]
MKKHYKHFNAATTVDAAEAYKKHVEKGGKMMVTLAGAMSTAELGKSLAEMIRNDKVHAITCTGANLEEDLFNLVAHKHYKRVPHYRDLKPVDEKELRKNGFNRVTDTCIPEEDAMRKIEGKIVKLWKEADERKESKLPHQYFYELIESGVLKDEYQIDLKDSWLLAAAEKKLPLFVPGWEDSTLGNIFVSYCIQPKNEEQDIKSFNTVKGGLHYMKELIDWYAKTSAKHSIGFFQIGGGIAGDFPICVVPTLRLDLDRKVPYWGYFCQISDSTTSYGSYSGAVPNEKITWDKIDVETPKFIIESDATIVAPLIFAYVLGW